VASSDNRSVREKLQELASHPRTPPHEAEVARILLAKLTANRPNPETPRVLTRDEILGAPDDSRPAHRRLLTVRYGGLVFSLYQDEYNLIFGPGSAMAGGTEPVILKVERA
jgi:hypothetical protein